MSTVGASLCGNRCVAAVAQDPAAFAAARASESPPDAIGVVRAREPETVGPLDPNIIQFRVQRYVHIDALNVCYQRALIDFPDLRGRFIVNFTVDRTGRVTRPGVDHKSELSGPLVRDCIFKAMRRWRFPASNVGHTTVRLPLDFTTYPP